MVGGASPNEGRVQVYYNGWKSVCGSGWDFCDARVVCRQLGYGDALNVPTSSLYGIRGRDELSVMNNVECSGQESLLKNCEHTFGNLECSVTNVASALCTGKWRNIFKIFGGCKFLKFALKIIYFFHKVTPCTIIIDLH